MNNNQPFHKSVLLDPVCLYALPDNPTTFVDATFGLGGHTKALLNKYPSLNTVIGIDRDEEILNYSIENFDDKRIKRVCANASALPDILKHSNISSNRTDIFVYPQRT